MKCPNCSFEQPGQHAECRRCGVIFSKYHQQQKNTPPTGSIATAYSEPAPNPGEFISELLFNVKPETNPFIFGGRVLFFLFIFIRGLRFIFAPMESNYVFDSFWHLVNLPFHEVGHIVYKQY